MHQMSVSTSTGVRQPPGLASRRRPAVRAAATGRMFDRLRAAGSRAGERCTGTLRGGGGGVGGA